MERKEIIKVLEKNDSTVLSFPDRGPWGDNRYRGNCSGWIQASLIWKYDVKKLAELFAGGGTGSDVARDMHISYIGADLNPSPVRHNILTINAVTDEVPDEFSDADMLFMHPPYGAEIRIPYAGYMYKDLTGEASRYDLGQMKWPLFMQTLNKIIMKYYCSMAPGARMSILMGNVRRKGHYYSMLSDIVKPGIIEQTMVKVQHNYRSSMSSDQSQNFYPTEHEDILVIRKPGGLLICFKMTTEKQVDIRDSYNATWKDLVRAVLNDLGTATCEDIYAQIEGHAKCENNPNWKAKIRQTLQSGGFKHIAKSTWSVA